MLCGNVSAVISGGFLTILVSITTDSQHKMDDENIHEIWESTRDIDNPLSPWTELYARYPYDITCLVASFSAIRYQYHLTFTQ